MYCKLLQATYFQRKNSVNDCTVIDGTCDSLQFSLYIAHLPRANLSQALSRSLVHSSCFCPSQKSSWDTPSQNPPKGPAKVSRLLLEDVERTAICRPRPAQRRLRSRFFHRLRRTPAGNSVGLRWESLMREMRLLVTLLR